MEGPGFSGCGRTHPEIRTARQWVPTMCQSLEIKSSFVTTVSPEGFVPPHFIQEKIVSDLRISTSS